MAESRYIALFSSCSREDLMLARSLSPSVEVHSSGCILLSVPESYEETALVKISEAHIAGGRIFFAISSTRPAAFFAARYAPGTRIPPHQEQQQLRDYPLELLQLWDSEIAAEYLGTLLRWGIRRFGELSDLPRQQLVSRLGQKGVFLQRLARGEDVQPLPACPEPLRFEESQELDWELGDLEPLSFILGNLLERLCRKLLSRGLATDRLTIQLELVNGIQFERAVPLAFPMSNWRVLLSLLRLKLQSDSPEAAVVRVDLEARPAKPRIVQYSLLESASANPEKISRTLARLTALVGQEHCGIAELEDTHRSDSFQVREFPLRSGRKQRKGTSARGSPNGNGNGSRPQLTLKRVRPPLAIQLSTDQIVTCSGPWKCSGDWWKGENGMDRSGYWEREEWDLELSNGKICRVYWDTREEKWLLEAIYD